MGRRVLCPHCGSDLKIATDVLNDPGVRSVMCAICAAPVKLGETKRVDDFEVELRYPKRRILVVEDSRAMAMMLRDTLEEAGYEVTLASDGEEAVEVVAEAHPDLILLDLKLPKRSGFEVLEALHHRFGGAAPPVLVTSAAYNPADVIGRLRKLGVQGFINKAALFDTVLDRVHALVSGKTV